MSVLQLWAGWGVGILALQRRIAQTHMLLSHFTIVIKTYPQSASQPNEIPNDLYFQHSTSISSYPESWIQLYKIKISTTCQLTYHIVRRMLLLLLLNFPWWCSVMAEGNGEKGMRAKTADVTWQRGYRKNHFPTYYIPYYYYFHFINYYFYLFTLMRMCICTI